ncbi:hypothetical protein [Fodinicola feengrottensis]|uniref:Uncharacterized protein n=1 Tax=Fodinicola feengrottensis TaxID=435914 RepID=A0ABP4S511_9ACTN|nr:hypothetical protein [Fodinicola feengrottensis]
MHQASIQRRRRHSIVAGSIQLLTIVPFLLGSAVVLGYGPAAQAAAEAAVVSQGSPASVLVKHGIFFGSKVSELPVPVAIAIILVVLAVLNLAANRIGRILSWIFHPLLFVAGCVIIPGQLFTAQLLESAFKNSGDAALERLDAYAVVDAAMRVMPDWLTPVDWAKLVLTTGGSLAVIVLLAGGRGPGRFATRQGKRR